MLRKESIQLISLVPNEEYSIRELAETVADLVGVKGITFDETKADGQFRKTMKNTLLISKLKNFKFTSLREGLSETIKNYANETRF
jgi:nucleoside-diphosphate-sugar epimerase